MRALIVDDSRFLRERMKQMLQPMGWECAEATHGGEALAALQHDASYDLLLLDVNMPEMGGMECVRRLRAEQVAPAMKVMMVTTEADSAFILGALEYGADEFLMKPFTLETVQGKLQVLGLPQRYDRAALA